MIELTEPWQVPTGSWDTISLLDVLEHHPDPRAFLATMPSRRLLVKVPLADGPLAAAARWRRALRHFGLLEALFLVDDVSSHEVLFTATGVQNTAERAGWRLVRTARLADVGSELPDRLRLDGALTSRGLRPVVAAGGATVAGLARLWSDTTVFLFERSDA